LESTGISASAKTLRACVLIELGRRFNFDKNSSLDLYNEIGIWGLEISFKIEHLLSSIGARVLQLPETKPTEKYFVSFLKTSTIILFHG
jgi:hypothetical protein